MGKHKGKGKNHQPGSVPSRVQSNEPGTEQPPHSTEASAGSGDRGDILALQRSNLTVQKAIAFLGFLYAAVASFQLWTMREALEADHRPWLTVDSASVTRLAPEEEVGASLRIKNSGHSPALHMVIKQWVSAVDPAIPIPPPDYRTARVESVAISGPGEVGTVPFVGGGKLPTDIYRLLGNGRAVLRLYIRKSTTGTSLRRIAGRRSVSSSSR